MLIALVPVTSSNLTHVGYDATEKILYIRFVSGQVYAYAVVPPTVHAGLLAAPSKGVYFQTEIRTTYSYTKVRSADVDTLFTFGAAEPQT